VVGVGGGGVDTSTVMTYLFRWKAGEFLTRQSTIKLSGKALLYGIIFFGIYLVTFRNFNCKRSFFYIEFPLFEKNTVPVS